MAEVVDQLEWQIEKDIKKFLRARKWFVQKMHGNEYQAGFPDLFCTHPEFRIRLIEVKRPNKYSFTPAQVENFKLMTAHGAGIWVLTAANEREYSKLFRPPNWEEMYLLKALRT